jgi:hypothetical protein
MSDRRVLVLLFGCAVFAAALDVELHPGNSDVAPTSAIPTVEANPITAEAPRPQPDRLRATILSRPLFSPTRRPPPRDGPHDFDLSDKRLTGIIIAPEHRMAIFAVTGAKPLALTEGETVNGWEIESITAQEISLRGPAGTRTLRPSADESLVRQTTSPPFINPDQPLARAPAAATPAPGRVNVPPALLGRRRSRMSHDQ